MRRHRVLCLFPPGNVSLYKVEACGNTRGEGMIKNSIGLVNLLSWELDQGGTLFASFSTKAQLAWEVMPGVKCEIRRDHM